MVTKNGFVKYDSNLVERARELRNNPTRSESILWNRLKGKQILGYDFHRQKPVGHFIVDFFCPKLLLAVEIDGPVHLQQKEADAVRQNYLEAEGLSFLRFTAMDVESNPDGVCEIIREYIERQKTQKKL